MLLREQGNALNKLWIGLRPTRHGVGAKRQCQYTDYAGFIGRRRHLDGRCCHTFSSPFAPPVHSKGWSVDSREL